MALLNAPAEIGPNSLEMLPLEAQEFSDYCTGEILVTGIKARRDFACLPNAAEIASGLGPLVGAEISAAQELTQNNATAQTSMTQQTVDALAVPIITDQEIGDAPNAVPLGTSGPTESPFTATQIAAAQHNPINWSDRLTIQHNMRRHQSIAHQATGRQLTPPQRSGGVIPRPAWGSPAAASGGWCATPTPWAKLFLFGGLGLLAVGILQRKK